MLVVVVALLAVPLATLSLAALRAVPADIPRLVADLPDGPPLPPGVRRADLALVARSVPAAPVAGLAITYTLEVTSRGPDTPRRTTVVETLPPGFAFRSASAPSGTRCTPAGSVVTCVGPGLRPGGSRSISITALVDGRAAAATLVNTARVSSDLPDPVARNGFALDAARVTRNADLVASAVGPTAAVVPGTRATLGAAVTNRGPATADGVVLGVVVPPGATVVSADVAGGRCTTGGSDVACSVASPLPPGARVAARVVVALGAEVVDDAVAHTVTATSLTHDPRPVGSTAVARTPVARSAALETTTSGPTALVAGATGTWTTVVTNRGPSTARDVTVAGTTRGATVTDRDTSSGTCTAVRCALDSLAPGESARITTLAAVPAAATAGPVRLTTRTDSSTPAPAGGTALPGGTTAPDGAARPDGTARSGEAALPDGAGARDDATRAERGAPPGLATPDVTTTSGGDGTAATTAVSGLADLAVAVSQGRPPDLGGTLDLAADFTLRARNLGPSDATDTVLTAALPPGSRATAVPAGCAFDGARVTCRYPRIPAGTEVAAAVATAQLPGVLPALLTGPRRLTAAVSSAVRDPVPQNDTGTAAPGPTLGGPDLAVVAVEGAPRAAAGDVVRRTLTVRNRGTAPARSVVLDDAPVPGVTPVALPAGCRASAAGTSCDLGSLAAGEVRAVTLAARLAPDRPAGPLARSSAVRLAGDPSPSDNVTSSSVPVDARADLRTTASRVGDGPLLAGGPSVTYRVRTTNAGPSVAPGVVLDLDAPTAGRRVLAASVRDGRCQVRTTSALCRVATMAPGEETEALVTVAATGDLAGEASEVSATATSMVADPTAADARAVERTAVSRAVDLRARLEAEPAAAAAGSVTAGSPTTVRVTLAEVGPSTAAGTVLSSTLAPGTRALSATSTRGGCAISGGRVDCPVGDLPAGGTATATIVVEPAPEARGPVVVTATGTSATPGPAAPAALSLRVAPQPEPPEMRLADAEAAGLDPGVGNPSGPGEGLTIAARISRLPAGDAVGLVLAGVALTAVVAALALRRRRSGRPARRGRA